jgi:hypothetical protein
MNLTEPQASAFQTIYDEYETQRKALGTKENAVDKRLCG